LLKVSGFATMVPEVTELNFDRLEKVSGLNFKEAHRRKLLKSLNRYLADDAILSAAPKVPQVRERLKKIKKHTQALSNLLGDHSELGQAAVRSVWPFNLVDLGTFSRVLWRLSLLCEASVIDMGEGESGRPAKLPLLQLMFEVGYVFDDAGGEGIVGCSSNTGDSGYHGPLLELACELLTQTKKDGGLGFSRQTIGKWLKNRRKVEG